MDTPDIDVLLENISPGMAPLSLDEGRRKLVEAVNHLLVHDFNKLVWVLYRVDVSEPKLKRLLQENAGTDAAELITDLLIERQQEKARSRERFKGNADIPEEDKW
jgi:hypothetical protein